MKRTLLAVVVLMLCALMANAATVPVNCNLPGPLGKIGNVLKMLNPAGPNTITVSGTCRENLFIKGFDRLTLIAKPGAVLTDASGGQEWAVVYSSIRAESPFKASPSPEEMPGSPFPISASAVLMEPPFRVRASEELTLTTPTLHSRGTSYKTTAMDYTLTLRTFKLRISSFKEIPRACPRRSRLVGTGWIVHNNTQNGVFVNTSSNFQLIDSNVFPMGGMASRSQP